jgi:putative methionine-R-sulfoxide reductase with GAF domain
MKWLTHESAEGLLAITSVARTLTGDARLADVGGLLWMILRQSVPCDAMAIYLIDDDRGHVAVRFAAGDHAEAIRHVTRPIGTGIAGAVAVHWKAMVNGDPAFDLGRCAIDSAHPLRSCLAMPLVADESLIAILAIYSEAPAAYSNDHARLLDLVAARLADAMVDLAIIEEDLQPSQARVAPPLQLVKAGTTPEAQRPDPPAARAVRVPRMQVERRRAASSLPLSTTMGPTG